MAFTGKSPAKTIGLMASKPGSGGAGRSASITVSPMRASATRLILATIKPTSPAAKFVEHDRFGRERAEGFHFVDFVVRAQADLHARRDAALHHAHQHHGAAINVEPGIENQRAQRRVRRAFRRRHVLHDGFEHLVHAQAALRADRQRIVGGNREHIFDLFLHEFGLRGGQIDFVDHRNDREIMARGEKRVGDGLRLDALARVHDQQRALAGGKRARNFVGKIHVAGRVDQVQAVFVAVARGVMQANAFRFDGDAALALQVHRVEHLRAHFALGQRAGQLQQAVGQRGFAVVNVRDDAEIPDVLRIHLFPELLPILQLEPVLVLFEESAETVGGIEQANPLLVIERDREAAEPVDADAALFSDTELKGPSFSAADLLFESAMRASNSSLLSSGMFLLPESA